MADKERNESIGQLETCVRCPDLSSSLSSPEFLPHQSQVHEAGHRERPTPVSKQCPPPSALGGAARGRLDNPSPRSPGLWKQHLAAVTPGWGKNSFPVDDGGST